MRVDVLVPDRALTTQAPSVGSGVFGQLVDAAGAQLERADVAEAAFTNGRGGIMEMMVERARADIALQIATTGALRATQALNAILGMQI